MVCRRHTQSDRKHTDTTHTHMTLKAILCFTESMARRVNIKLTEFELATRYVGIRHHNITAFMYYICLSVYEMFCIMIGLFIEIGCW